MTALVALIALVGGPVLYVSLAVRVARRCRRLGVPVEKRHVTDGEGTAVVASVGIFLGGLIALACIALFGLG